MVLSRRCLCAVQLRAKHRQRRVILLSYKSSYPGAEKGEERERLTNSVYQAFFLLPLPCAWNEASERYEKELSSGQKVSFTAASWSRGCPLEVGSLMPRPNPLTRKGSGVTSLSPWACSLVIVSVELQIGQCNWIYESHKTL